MKKACTITAILNLFGEYILPRKEKDIWVGSLIKLLKPIGFTENAIRLSLSRLKKHKALESFRIGKKSYYRITKFGKKWVKYGEDRAYHFEEEHKWDGKWRLIIYNIPEKQRKKRDAFRCKLTSVGFGAIGNSIYIYPHDFSSKVYELAEHLKIEKFIDIFEAEYVEKDTKELLNRVWNLKKIEKAFETYMNKYQNRYKTCKKGKLFSPSKCFATKFKMSSEWIELSFEDPKIPPELLPKTWKVNKVKKFYFDFFNLLDPISNAYFESVFKSSKMKKK